MSARAIWFQMISSFFCAFRGATADFYKQKSGKKLKIWLSQVNCKCVMSEHIRLSVEPLPLINTAPHTTFPFLSVFLSVSGRRQTCQSLSFKRPQTRRVKKATVLLQRRLNHWNRMLSLIFMFWPSLRLRRLKLMHILQKFKGRESERKSEHMTLLKDSLQLAFCTGFAWQTPGAERKILLGAESLLYFKGEGFLH